MATGRLWAATILALLSTLAYAVCDTAAVAVPVWVTDAGFYFLPIALPVVAAALISLISINDLQRRVARYREMQLVLEDSRKRISFCQTWNSLERIVLKTEAPCCRRCSNGIRSPALPSPTDELSESLDPGPIP